MADLWLIRLILQLLSEIWPTPSLVKNRRYICSLIGLKVLLFPHVKGKEHELFNSPNVATKVFFKESINYEIFLNYAIVSSLVLKWLGKVLEKPVVELASPFLV